MEDQRTGKASRGQCSDEPSHYSPLSAVAAEGFMQKLSAKTKWTVSAVLGFSPLSWPKYYTGAVLGG